MSLGTKQMQRQRQQILLGTKKMQKLILNLTVSLICQKLWTVHTQKVLIHIMFLMKTTSILKIVINISMN